MQAFYKTLIHTLSHLTHTEDLQQISLWISPINKGNKQGEAS